MDRISNWPDIRPPDYRPEYHTRNQITTNPDIEYDVQLDTDYKKPDIRSIPQLCLKDLCHNVMHFYTWIVDAHYIMILFSRTNMVLIFDSSSKIVAHVRNNLFYLICLRHLIRSRKKPIFIHACAIFNKYHEEYLGMRLHSCLEFPTCKETHGNSEIGAHTIYVIWPV